MALSNAERQRRWRRRRNDLLQTNPEVIKEVERGLEHRLSDIVSQTFEKAGGVDTVAEMLNLADRSTEKGCACSDGPTRVTAAAQADRLQYARPAA